jgi:hypothetical protein
VLQLRGSRTSLTECAQAPLRALHMISLERRVPTLWRCNMRQAWVAGLQEVVEPLQLLISASALLDTRRFKSMHVQFATFHNTQRQKRQAYKHGWMFCKSREVAEERGVVFSIVNDRPCLAVSVGL